MIIGRWSISIDLEINYLGRVIFMPIHIGFGLHMRKLMGIVMGILIIVTALYNSPYLDLPENTTAEPNLNFLPGPDFKKIGYYVNSSSEFVNAIYYLMIYNPVGPYIEPFTSFEGLSNYSMNDLALILQTPTNCFLTKSNTN